MIEISFSNHLPVIFVCYTAGMENNGDRQSNRQREIAIGDIALDLAMHKLRCNGKTVALTLSESKLLTYIAFKAGTPVPIRELLEHVMETRPLHKTTVVEPHICRLRAKMRAIGSKTTIRTMRRQGYVIDATLRQTIGHHPPQPPKLEDRAYRDCHIAHIKPPISELPAGATGLP